MLILDPSKEGFALLKSLTVAALLLPLNARAEGIDTEISQLLVGNGQANTQLINATQTWDRAKLEKFLETAQNGEPTIAEKARLILESIAGNNHKAIQLITEISLAGRYRQTIDHLYAKAEFSNSHLVTNELTRRVDGALTTEASSQQTEIAIDAIKILTTSKAIYGPQSSPLFGLYLRCLNSDQPRLQKAALQSMFLLQNKQLRTVESASANQTQFARRPYRKSTSVLPSIKMLEATWRLIESSPSPEVIESAFFLTHTLIHYDGNFHPESPGLHIFERFENINRLFIRELIKKLRSYEAPPAGLMKMLFPNTDTRRLKYYSIFDQREVADFILEAAEKQTGQQKETALIELAEIGAHGFLQSQEQTAAATKVITDALSSSETSPAVKRKIFDVIESKKRKSTFAKKLLKPDCKGIRLRFW